jgi:hypothetical protein
VWRGRWDFDRTSLGNAVPSMVALIGSGFTAHFDFDPVLYFVGAAIVVLAAAQGREVP